ALAQQRAERSAECMNIKDAAALVTLGDASKPQVAVHDFAELVRHSEQWHFGWQRERDGPASSTGFGLEDSEFVREPLAQIVGEVRAEGDAIAFAVLLVRSLQFGKRKGLVKMQLSNR